MKRGTARYPISRSTGILPRMANGQPSDNDWHDVADVVISRITERRNALGLSAQAASQLAGLSKDAIRDIERGREPGYWKMARLASALGCDLNYFDPRIDPGNSQPVAPGARLAASIDELLQSADISKLAEALTEAERIVGDRPLSKTTTLRVAVELFLGRAQAEEQTRAHPQ